ncbi:hypothetical protein TK11N_24120 [Tetragenococcus koreensis]|uniref:Uncharacterized protein n=1 Tax=Tetragenococcus koreensis TaxID=290335 RepID=A0AAN4ZU31_9ENTE|nr:hypothetical protein TK11N_24120 [Tetragenococcus koreensis]GEQ53064.1 hypothetical protein TK12N_24080 [Tetragenococcus koreensis]GEQ55568.1 hypothetical protein TK2N_24120 [Tetragenococcus koreensis]GEQ58065.1 hypothetical protein TK4N_24080 [Tetragenococcus koreensis]GEQ60568.1 hypothetical protein TK6N_24070 [Tetragenococcus koreensis]
MVHLFAYIEQIGEALENSIDVDHNDCRESILNCCLKDTFDWYKQVITTIGENYGCNKERICKKF